MSCQGPVLRVLDLRRHVDPFPARNRLTKVERGFPKGTISKIRTNNRLNLAFISSFGWLQLSFFGKTLGEKFLKLREPGFYNRQQMDILRSCVVANSPIHSIPQRCIYRVRMSTDLLHAAIPAFLSGSLFVRFCLVWGDYVNGVHRLPL